nr:hypothetical protein BaRGS_012548 [Batillaria attramentaria]
MIIIVTDLGEAVLNVVGCLVPFLEHDLLDSLPYTVASTLAIFPPTLHKDTIDLLCSSLLPMTLGYDGCAEPTYASESAAAIITMVFQHTENGAFHSQILECFMSMKKNIINNCKSEKNIAMCTCFSIECASFNGNRPIRYCATCHEQRHGQPDLQQHVFHLSIPDIWSCTPEVMRYLMDAIVSLLKEASPLGAKRMVEMGEEHRQAAEEDDLFNVEDAGERKLLSRYGIWLLVEQCKPQEDIPIIKEGLNCFFCLVPYNIITFEIWDYVMPYWLESIRTEVPEDELSELKVLLSKAFDIDMCPLPFTLERMYNFVFDRFDDPSTCVQEQALQWLQATMQQESVSPMSPQKLPQVCDPYDLYDKESELVLPCFIIMPGCSAETEMMRKPWDGQHTCDSDTKRVNCMFCQNIALWHQLASQLMEYISPRDPLKLPQKELPKADEVKHQTISESPRGAASPDSEKEEKEQDFDLPSMPVYLQLYDALTHALSEVTDTDALFALLSSLKLLILHGESLNYTINQYTEYITYTMRKSFLPSLWKMLQTEHSHLSTLVVPLLLHCMTLSTGAAVLWHLVEDDFSHDDWKVRFAAVEKVTVLSRCLEPDTIRNNQVIQTSLAHAFCHMVGSVEDINSSVAQRTIMFLETIRPSGLKCLIQCLEFQFDTVIQDRCLILHRIQLLSLVLAKVRILSWEFFLNRFDTMSLEAQVDLESSGDIACATVEKDKSCVRQWSAPQFNLTRRMTSKLNLGGQLREFTDEESNFAALLQRAMDLEGVDRDVVYQLVALLMKFMVRSEEHVQDGDGKAQVLDRNFKLGNTILPITLLLLQYCPSPQRYASDYQPPNYTLWYLEPHTRLSWLRALLVILYKYQISTSPVSAIIQTLVQLVINTVEAQHHRCRKTEDGFPMPTPTVHRSKADLSKMSVSDLENIQETDTPPQSPSSSKQDTEDRATVHGQTDGADSSEGDAESTPTLPGGKKDGVRRVSKVRHPRRIIEYSEPDSADDSDIKTDTEPAQKSEKKGPVRLQSPKDELEVEDPSFQPLQEITSELSPKSAAVERKMVQQLQEFSESLTETSEKTQKHSDESQKLSEAGSSKGASSTTEASSQSARADGTTSDFSREAASEGESTEESEKTQTSDGESDRHHAATDSGGDATQEESKDEGIASESQSSAILRPNFRQRKERKTGLTTIELQRRFPDLRRARRAEMMAKSQATGSKKPLPNSRYGENVMVERCSECNLVLEQYDDETIGLCITVLATFIHREPTLATPMLLNMLQCVSSIARQYLRCVLHQMAPHGIFPMLFQSNLDDPNFFKTMASALVDFNELTSHAPLLFLLEGLNERKNLPQDTIMLTLNNLSTYLTCVSLESSVPMWTNILTQFDIFFRRLVLPNPCNLEPVLSIIITLLKVYVITNVRGILEPFSKILSFAIQNSTLKLQHLIDICSLCNRVFTRERDKLILTRTVIYELVQVLRFKSLVPDDNLLMMVQFVVLDAGGTLCLSNSLSEASTLYAAHSQTLISTCSAECMRQHLTDCIEFIGDLHTLTKVKSNTRGGSTGLNEDTLGSQLKSGIAQYIALEISRGNGRDHRAIARYLPWLYHPPSAMQQGPKEFIDCIGHIRLLSWLLIGSLTHTAVTEGLAQINCLPIPLEASCHIADHIMVIMTGFAEQSNASVLHMSSLFHAFILCQLWTLYCESAAAMHAPSTQQHQLDMAMIMDFWARVTPGILQLLSHSKVLPGHLHVRMQAVQNWEPPHPTKDHTSFNSYNPAHLAQTHPV